MVGYGCQYCIEDILDGASVVLVCTCGLTDGFYDWGIEVPVNLGYSRSIIQLFHLYPALIDAIDKIKHILYRPTGSKHFEKFT